MRDKENSMFVPVDADDFLHLSLSHSIFLLLLFPPLSFHIDIYMCVCVCVCVCARVCACAHVCVCVCVMFCVMAIVEENHVGNIKFLNSHHPSILINHRSW